MFALLTKLLLAISSRGSCVEIVKSMRRVRCACNVLTASAPETRTAGAFAAESELRDAFAGRRCGRIGIRT
jgi:hypothetical protein